MSERVTRFWHRAERLDGGCLFVTLLAGAYLAAASIVGLVLVAVALTGNWGSLSWSAASTLASIVSTLIAVGAAAAIGFTVREYQGQLRRDARDRQRDRVDRQPYLRVDVALADRHEANFRPPPTAHIYTPRELRLWDNDPLAELRPPPWSGYHELVVWVTNHQKHPLGLADDVQVAVRVMWREASDAANYGGTLVTFNLAYLAPAQTTAVGLGQIRRDIGELYVILEDVVYRDVFGDSSRDTHGALEMAYTGIDVRNERAAIRSLGQASSADRHKGGRGRADEP